MVTKHKQLFALGHTKNQVQSVAYLGFHFGVGGGKLLLENAWRDGSVICSPEKFSKNCAIWCVLENILLKFCQKNCKNIYFLYKNTR